jgi:predicted dehydrogenase
MNSSKVMADKTVCIVGLGIGKLYVSACKYYNWDVITVDQNKALNADYLNVDDIPKDVHIDLAVICTPNYTHERVARQLGSRYVTNIVVEKPGFQHAGSWLGFQQQYPKSRLWMVKNNQFRTLFADLQDKEIEKIQLFWLNKNRIPGAGSWFTDKYKSYSGVSRDLMPHLLSVAQRTLGHCIATDGFTAQCYQQYDMSQLQNDSTYGNYDVNGIYDVDDCAYFKSKTNNIDIECFASWKLDIDVDIVEWRFFIKGGANLTYGVGLCPESAYETMLHEYMYADEATYRQHQKYDVEIHSIIDHFVESEQVPLFAKLSI